MSFPKVYIQLSNFSHKALDVCIEENFANIDYPNLKLGVIDYCSHEDTESFSKSNKQAHNIEFVNIPPNLDRIQVYQIGLKSIENSDWFINLDYDSFYIDTSWISVCMKIADNSPLENIVHIQSNFPKDIIHNFTKPIKVYGDNFFLISGYDYVQLCIKHRCFSHMGSIFKANMLKIYGAYSEDCLDSAFLTAAKIALQGNVLIGSYDIGVSGKYDKNFRITYSNQKKHIINQTAYYRFFEWSENYLQFNQLKKLIESYEGNKDSLFNSEHSYSRNLIAPFQNKSLSFFKTLSGSINIIRKNEKLQNISHGLFTRIVSVLISIITLPLIIKNIGISDYSWIGIYTSLISAIYIFDFGFTSLITKELAQNIGESKEKLKIILASQECIYSLLGMVIFSLVYLLSEWLGDSWFIQNNKLEGTNNLFKIIAFALMVQWPHSFYTSALFGLNKQVISNYMQLGFSFLKNPGVILLFYFFKPSIELFFYWQIAISILTIIVQRILIYHEVPLLHVFKYFSWAYLKNQKKLALGISMISLFGFVYNDLTNFLIARWLGKQDFGFYSILLSIVLLFTMFTATVKSALFPHINKIVKTEKLSSIQRSYTIHFKIISLCLIPFSVMLFIFREDFLNVWLHNVELVNKLNLSFGWIIIGSLCNALMIIPGAYLIALSKPRLLIYMSFILAFIAIPLLLHLIRYFQFEGAAIYWMIINVIPLPFLLIYLWHHFKTSVLDQIIQSLLIPTAISCLVFLLVFYISNKLALSNFYSLCLSILFLLNCYAVILYLNSFLFKESLLIKKVYPEDIIFKEC